MHGQATIARSVADLRAFNRFYTRVIGVLGDGLLRTPYSLTEARVIFELAQGDSTDFAALRRRLGLDAGYLSRILSRFEEQGLIGRTRSATDGRRQTIGLTEAGRTAFAVLDSRSAEDNRALLAPLGDADRRRLATAMATIRELLEPHRGGGVQDGKSGAGYVVRPPQAGDYGWVVRAHGLTYAEEYGWDATFEALVARIVAGHVEGRDSASENAWIAERRGEPVGCVFCVRRDETVAQLRLLLVVPEARGSGIGTALVEECIRFAKQAGYSRLMLWTNDVLVDARRIYEKVGLRLVEEEAHHSFGHDLVGQNWELEL